MAATSFTPISLYYSSTATNVPTAGNLVAGELALNTADGKLFYKDSSNVVQVIGTKGGVGTSSTTQVLYNSSGLVTGSSSFVFDGNNVGIGMTPVASYGSLQVGSAVTSALGVSGLKTYVAGTNSALGQNGNISVITTDAQGADIGGSIGLGGKFVSTGFSVLFAQISGRKENSTDNNSAGYLQFATQPNGGTPTERMRIDSSGNLLQGTTNSNPITVPVVGNAFLGTSGGIRISQSSGASYFAVNGTTGTQINFYTYSGAPSLAGYINCPTSTTTAYVSVSDYRLKENIKPMIGALEKVALLKPCTYSWKHDGSDGQGFIAHELSEICSDAVVGKKDEVNEDGSIKPQGIDTSFLVATLTAAIQELNAKVTALEAQLSKP